MSTTEETGIDGSIKGLPQTVYVVMGSTGEYSDRSEWPVVAYVDEARAQKHVEAATAQANLCQSKFPDHVGTNPFDPEMQLDYTGTRYYLYSVGIDLSKSPASEQARS